MQKFDSNGGYLTQWGKYGTENGQFSFPAGVASDSGGNIYVADSHNNRIQKFSSNGAYLTQWGGSGNGNGQFNFPNGISVDKSDKVYVADMNNHRVQKFDSTGSYLTQWGSQGSGNGQFNQLRAVAVDSNGNVFVAEYGNNRIQKFATACVDTNGSTQQGIDLVKANPGNYQLFNQTQLNAAVSTATASMYTKAQLDEAVKTEQLKWDANGDGKIGLEDIIRMLQIIAGIRP